MIEKINVGLLGHGIMGQVYSKILNTSQKYNLKCVAEINEELLRCVPMNVSTYRNYEELLASETNLDAVIIALPTALHVNAAENALKRDLPVLLEKPMGINSEEAEYIQQIAFENNTKLMVGMLGRYHPEFVEAYNAATNGKIGDILSFNEIIHEGYKNFPMQRLDKEQFGRGPGLTNGIHTVDRFNWFSRSTKKSVKITCVVN